MGITRVYEESSSSPHGESIYKDYIFCDKCGSWDIGKDEITVEIRELEEGVGCGKILALILFFPIGWISFIKRIKDGSVLPKTRYIYETEKRYKCNSCNVKFVGFNAAPVNYSYGESDVPENAFCVQTNAQVLTT